SNPDALWGPSIHWNTRLSAYVVVVNRSCCVDNWPQEGIYASINADVSDPTGWTPPVKIMDGSSIGFAPGYYPQVVGPEAWQSDTLAGGNARLFISGVSNWEIEFLTTPEVLTAPPVAPPDSPDPPPPLIPLR